jgi:hypothetical protein
MIPPLGRRAKARPANSAWGRPTLEIEILLLIVIAFIFGGVFWGG